MKSLVTVAAALVVCSLAFMQSKPARAQSGLSNRDQLGLSCAQILQMTSTDWITDFSQKGKDDLSGNPKALRAIAVYGKCYDARTDRLAASLGRKGMGSFGGGARANLPDFEKALQTFTSKVFALSDPPADAVKIAYAQLYEKQFRYEFYRADEEKRARLSEHVPKTSASANLSAPKPNDAAPPVVVSPDPAEAAPGDANPVTMAKNHFGQLLDALPEGKEHQLHSAFGDIVGRGDMSEDLRLAIYRYAIFVLEPLSASPFSPPPF